MYEYIKGNLQELTPVEAIIEAGGIGYSIAISLNTYALIQEAYLKTCKLYLHHIQREDAQMLYGFAQKEERSLFRLLISVSGVGAGTARTILSSLSTEELQNTIAVGDITPLKAVKGIGLKTAQRIIVDLKDKVNTFAESGSADIPSILASSHKVREEALSALANLGYPKSSVEKTLDTILKNNPKFSLEEIIKEALKTGM